MYQAYYNLKQEPFRLSPDPTFFYTTEHHREALSGLIYNMYTGKGLTVLTGEAGTGKTTLLHTLLDLLQKRHFATALCTNPVLSREELFDFLMLKFGVQCSSMLKSRQLVALEEKLIRNRAEGNASVLIVDEAHRLSMELLEEIRLLLNLETPKEKLLQIIIAGQPELNRMLQMPELRQFKQRVSCHCKLNPLTFRETKDYLCHRLQLAGMPNQALFSDTVIQRIHQYADGIPRVVNSLCDATLQTSFAARSPQVTVAIVDEVAGDLDLLLMVPRNEHLLKEPALVAIAAEQPHIAAETHPVNDGNGHKNNGLDPRIPFENYSNRPKSLGFFAELMDRWK